MKNIGFYCNWQVVKRIDGYYISSIDMRYLNAAEKHASKIYLLCSVRHDASVLNLQKIESDEVRVFELPEFHNYLGSLRHFWSIFWGLKNLVNESDFVYIRSPEPFSWVAPLFKRKGVVLNYHYTSSPIEVILNNEKESVLKRFVKVALFYPEYMMLGVAAYFNRCSVNGKGAAKKLPFFLAKKAKVSYESSITKSEIEEKSFRSVLNSHSVKFLSVGRLQAGKGLFVLIDAFGILFSEHPELEFTLTIVGDGPMRRDLESRVDKLSLKNVVKFSGSVANGPDLNAYYSDSDVFVMTSQSETGPRVLIEALSESNFCISTDVGYVCEVIDNESGLIIEPGNVEQLYSSLCWVFNNKVLAKKMAYQGFYRVHRFSIDSFFSDIMAP